MRRWSRGKGGVQTETMERDPAAWKVQKWRPQCKVVFEIIVPGLAPFLTPPVQFNHIVDELQNVPFPKELMAQLRCKRAEQRAKETTILTGCPCEFIGYDGRDVGKQLRTETNLHVQWRFVTKANGEPYTVRVSYKKLMYYGRNIPRCPVRMRGRPGLGRDGGRLQRGGDSAGSHQVHERGRQLT